MKWMYVLLVVMTARLDKPQNISQVPGVTEFWPVEVQAGGQSVQAVSYYRFVGFETKEALDLYLAKYNVNEYGEAILIDLKTGKEYKVNQRRVTKKVQVLQEQFEKFDIDLSEEKPPEVKK